MDGPNDERYDGDRPDLSGETSIRPPRQGDTQPCNASDSNAMPPWNAGDLFGDFKIIELLGSGSAGFVYAAEDLLAHRRCAVKVLCSMSSRDMYRNKLGFRRMAPLRHPCLLQTDQLEIIDKKTVMTMEVIDGETLNALMRRLPQIAPEDAYAMLQTLLHDFAAGLSVMHFSGLIHRDIKPTNLMVRENGHGVIVDYGLVAHCDFEMDPRGIRPYIAGTPRYISPEAFWEQSYTPAGDVFSLGLVILDCLKIVSKSTPLMREGDIENWVRDQDEEMISAAVIGMDDRIPLVLRETVALMLAHDRGERLSSMDVVKRTRTEDNPIQLVTTHHLFGRERELELCLDWARKIYRGHTGRLHLHGEPGSGKSRFLDEIERHLQSNQWGQVFRVKCRSRENQTLQVLDQIADQIAERYARHDREHLRLDAVSAAILIDAFPQLKHVIDTDLREKPESFAGRSDRVDALTAALRLSRELRKVGPLIVIIDDAQWSDHDSNNVWDELQQDCEGFLGLITSSREPETSQRQAAEKTIHIGPLSQADSTAFLQTAATQCHADINRAGLLDLVEASRGNPFRLHELAVEFQPGRMLHRVGNSDDGSLSNLGDIDRFWKVRFDRLTEDAKSVFALIVTANAPVSVYQLIQLTNRSVEVDRTLLELVQQRLIHDDATGQECITVVHDKIADGLIENLSPQRLKQSHLNWAKHLKSQRKPRDFAARIAGHFYAAQQDGEALPYAIAAAAVADCAFAKAEAGEWYEKVLRQVAGPARQKHLRDAARCFDEADLPEKASEHYMTLADECDEPSERTRYHIRAAELLVRSGQMGRARALLAKLDDHLGIRNTHARNATQALGTVESCREQFHQLAPELCGSLLPETTESETGQVEEANESTKTDADVVPAVQGGNVQGDSSETPKVESIEMRQAHFRLQYCAVISPPMTILDLQETMRLIRLGASQSANHSSAEVRIHFGIMSCVFDVLLEGPSKSRTASINQRNQQLLTELRGRLANHPPGRMVGQVWAGLAMIRTLDLDWTRVPQAVNDCLRNYNSENEPMRFQIAHTRWLSLWADWQLGRWMDLRAVGLEMVDDANRRNDSFQRLLAASGFGGNAFLVADQVADLEHAINQNQQIDVDTGQVELASFFRWMQEVQLNLYKANWEQAVEQVKEMLSALDGSRLQRIMMVQVICDQLVALASLHYCQNKSKSARIMKMAADAIVRLRSQPNSYATLVAAQMSGIQERLRGETDSAIKEFQLAAELASDLGVFPYQLAAEDSLVQLRSPDSRSDFLRHQMTNRHVVSPEQLERLYTVAPPTQTSS